MICANDEVLAPSTRRTLVIRPIALEVLRPSGSRHLGCTRTLRRPPHRQTRAPRHRRPSGALARSADAPALPRLRESPMCSKATRSAAACKRTHRCRSRWRSSHRRRCPRRCWMGRLGAVCFRRRGARTGTSGRRPKQQRGLAESQQALARSYSCSPRKAGVSSRRSTSLSKIFQRDDAETGELRAPNPWQSRRRAAVTRGTSWVRYVVKGEWVGPKPAAAAGQRASITFFSRASWPTSCFIVFCTIGAIRRLKPCTSASSSKRTRVRSPAAAST
jgi:hypothetical protein